VEVRASIGANNDAQEDILRKILRRRTPRRLKVQLNRDLLCLMADPMHTYFCTKLSTAQIDESDAKYEDLIHEKTLVWLDLLKITYLQSELEELMLNIQNAFDSEIYMDPILNPNTLLPITTKSFVGVTMNFSQYRA
jgi:hypothetical protein